MDKGLYNAEWLSNILRRLKLTPRGALVLMAALNLAIDLPLVLYCKTWPVPKNPLASIVDWLYDFVVHPVILGYFCWFQTVGTQLFTELAHKNILVSQEHFKQVLTKCGKRMRSVWITRLCAALSLAFTAWFIIAFSLPNLLHLKDPPYRSWVSFPCVIVLRAPIVFVVFYALTLTVYDTVIVIAALNDLLWNHKIRVEPFAPDQAGGLGFIGRFSANLGCLVGVLGLLLCLRMLHLAGLSEPSNFVIILGFALYILLGPLVFFLPLWAAHTAMLTFRNDLLMGLTTKLNPPLTQLRSTYWQDTSQIKMFLEECEKRDEMQTWILKRVPVWPFSAGNVHKFFVFAYSPLLPPIISFIADLMK